MGSYRLRVRGRFDAAHHLTSYRGQPEPAHDHVWRVEVELSAAGLDDEGMAFDFVAVRRALVSLLQPLDHGDLNTVPPFDGQSPTAERIAAWIFANLRRSLPTAPLAAVTVWEGPDCAATYLGGESE